MREIIEEVESLVKRLHKIELRILGFYNFRGYNEAKLLIKEINDLITEQEL